MKHNDILIIGGGIAGLSTALSLARSGHGVQLFEKTQLSSSALLGNDHPLGYGLQLGPNAMRHLYDWGLESELNELICWPNRLRVRHAKSGKDLASMRLDPDMHERYGAPYASIHRADLQRVMVHALREMGLQSIPAVASTQAAAHELPYPPQLHMATPIDHFTIQKEYASVRKQEGLEWHGKLLIGADGIWSPTRANSLNDNPPEFTGSIAHRACFTQNAIPQRMRRYDVELWLGKNMHIVTYPVRRGEMLNVVLIPHQTVSAAQLQSSGRQADMLDNALASPAAVLAHTPMCKDLHDLMLAVTHQKYWQAWPIFERPPVRSVASFLPLPAQPLLLIGDAAHPMRPHLAQGAGMAIEDAALLAKTLAPFTLSDAIDRKALDNFVRERLIRVQKVQKKSVQMGKIYRATGLIGASRNLALRLFGRSLLRQHWLYKDRS